MASRRNNRCCCNEGIESESEYLLQKGKGNRNMKYRDEEFVQTMSAQIWWGMLCFFFLIRRKEKLRIDRKTIEKEDKKMLIGCTKNLLEFLKESPAEREEAIDPLFSWTANLIILNRRKTLVAVNDATKCCFVLYGLTTKMIPKISELLGCWLTPYNK